MCAPLQVVSKRKSAKYRGIFNAPFGIRADSPRSPRSSSPSELLGHCHQPEFCQDPVQIL